MPLSAQQLYDAAQLEPSSFGSVIDPDDDEADQIHEALAYLELNVLPVANSEVSVPVREALNDFTSSLDFFGITDMFGDLAPEIIALWDGAQVSYGRSELNKRVASNAKTYDEDSDQDRIQGNQRLAKLVALVTRWKASQAVAVEAAPAAYSGSVPIISTW